MKKLFILAVLSMLLMNCGNDDTNFISIEEYIEQNNLNVQTTPSGLMYIIDEPGSDEKPSVTSAVTVTYRGYRTDEVVFDSSSNPITFGLLQVIPGWTEGLQLFGKGGSGTLFIPSPLGYGPQSPSGLIPPNTDLIFDVQLIDFQ